MSKKFNSVITSKIFIFLIIIIVCVSCCYFLKFYNIIQYPTFCNILYFLNISDLNFWELFFIIIKHFGGDSGIFVVLSEFFIAFFDAILCICSFFYFFYFPTKIRLNFKKFFYFNIWDIKQILFFFAKVSAFNIWISNFIFIYPYKKSKVFGLFVFLLVLVLFFDLTTAGFFFDYFFLIFLINYVYINFYTKNKFDEHLSSEDLELKTILLKYFYGEKNEIKNDVFFIFLSLGILIFFFFFINEAMGALYVNQNTTIGIDQEILWNDWRTKHSPVFLLISALKFFFGISK